MSESRYRLGTEIDADGRRIWYVMMNYLTMTADERQRLAPFGKTDMSDWVSITSVTRSKAEALRMVFRLERGDENKWENTAHSPGTYGHKRPSKKAP